MELSEIVTEYKHIIRGYKLIQCQGFDIAASCELNLQEQKEKTVETYQPTTNLIIVEQGTMEVRCDNKVYSFTKGQFCLVRKYSHVIYTKRVTEDKKQFKSYVFLMPDTFIRKIIVNFKFEKDLEPIGERVLKLSNTQKIKTIGESIKDAVENGKPLNVKELETNIEEALKAIIDSNPRLAILFKEFSLAKRADLHLFMNNNYMLKVTLEQLAVLSGRSVSTFRREFKLLFGTTPHQWILKKRLQLAYKLVAETTEIISDISFDAGFEDLAHFSKSFKKEYGKKPLRY